MLARPAIRHRMNLVAADVSPLHPMPEEIRADSRRLLQRERASQTTAVACDRSQASGDNAFLLVSQFSVTGVPLA
jgi:hypothetical protein